MNLPVTSVRDIDVHGQRRRDRHARPRLLDPRRRDAAAPGGRAARRGPRAPLCPRARGRVRPAGFTGTPLPKDEPMAANPPAGAYIDYVLGAAASAPVVLRILDAQGGVVRSYSSGDRLPGTDLTKIRTAPEWTKPPVAPATTPGMHRFVWPFRYPAPAALADGNPSRRRRVGATRAVHGRAQRGTGPAHPATDDPAGPARDDGSRGLRAPVRAGPPHRSRRPRVWPRR